MNAKVLIWDWQDNIDEVIEDFREVLKDLGISVIEIDTQSDSLAVVIGNITGKEAQKIYDER